MEPNHTQVLLYYFTLCTICSTIGVLTNGFIVIASFCTKKLRNHYTLILGLAVAELLHCFSRAFAFAVRLRLLQTNRLLDLVPATLCAKMVYPVFMVIGWTVTPIFVTCISIKGVCQIACYSWYNKYWTYRTNWFINGGIATFAVAYVLTIVLNVVTNNDLITKEYLIAMCTNHGLRSIVFLLPLVFSGVSLLLSLVAIVLYYKKQRSSVATTAARSEILERLHAYIKWLITTGVANLFFGAVPMSVWAAILLIDEDTLSPKLPFLRYLSIFYVLQSVFISMACLHFAEYSEIMQKYIFRKKATLSDVVHPAVIKVI